MHKTRHHRMWAAPKGSNEWHSERSQLRDTHKCVPGGSRAHAVHTQQTTAQHVQWCTHGCSVQLSLTQTRWPTNHREVTTSIRHTRHTHAGGARAVPESWPKHGVQPGSAQASTHTYTVEHTRSHPPILVSRCKWAAPTASDTTARAGRAKEKG